MMDDQHKSSTMFDFVVAAVSLLLWLSPCGVATMCDHARGPRPRPMRTWQPFTICQVLCIRQAVMAGDTILRPIAPVLGAVRAHVVSARVFCDHLLGGHKRSRVGATPVVQMPFLWSDLHPCIGGAFRHL